MRSAALAIALAGLALAGGCSVILGFDDCHQDSDCAGRAPDGGDPTRMFCTSDHLCVEGLPEERLCMPIQISGIPASNVPPVVVAGLFRLSGATESKDSSMANAATLAVSEISQIIQRPISFVLCDTAGDSSHGLRAFNRAVNNYGAVAVVGPTTSSQLIAIYQQAVTKNVLMVSPSATSPSITQLIDQNLVWRTCANDLLQAKVLALQAKQLDVVMGKTGLLNVAYVNDAYGNGLFNSFVKYWDGTVASAPQFNAGDDPKPILATLAADSPAVALLIADSDSPALVHALSTAPAGLSNTNILMTDGAKGPDLLVNPDVSVLRRIRGTASGVDTGNPVFKAFRYTYMTRFGEDALSLPYVANTYDAVYLTLLAAAGIPGVKAVTGGQMAQVLSRVSVPGAMPIDLGPLTFVQGATALANGGSISVAGTSGPLKFDPTTGDVTTASMEVWDVNVSNPIAPLFETLTVVTP